MDKVYIHFKDITLKEANKRAADLQKTITKSVKITPDLIKKDGNTMDAGSILEIILASKTVVEIAKAISIWLIRNNNVKIIFKDKDKNEISIDKLDSGNQLLYDFLESIKS